MAGKTKPMSQIKQLLQLHKQGEKIKSIARTLGVSKNTVKAYLGKLTVLKFDIDQLLKLDEPELEAKFHIGNPAYKDTRFEYIKENLEFFEKELRRKGVTRQLLWEEYRASIPRGYSYTQFCFHLNQQLKARKPTLILEHEPGNKLFIDFAGEYLSYVNWETGEIIKCPVFVACLPYSDFAFAMAVRSQAIEELIHALRCCFEALGGSTKILVPDNMKTAVIKTSRYEPDLNRVLEDFCNHYNMAIVPARPLKPRDKGRVENQVRIIYTRVYAKLRNQHFFDIHSLNEAISLKTRQHNQTRMQQKPFSREERFLAKEKPMLQPLPEEPFEIKYYKKLKLAQNNHICLFPERHYYSAPYQYIGQSLKVIFTRSIVKIYANGKMIAMHQRDETPGGYTTIKTHLCSHHQNFLKLSPDYYFKRAESTIPELHEIIKLLFAGGRPPEQNYKSCDGLLSLHKKTDPVIFKKHANKHWNASDIPILS